MSDFEVCPVGTVARLAAVEAERDALLAEVDRITVNGTHSCHAECQRPVCRLTRERDALLADMEAIRDCTLLDAEGPELRAQNECNHRRAVQAIARTKGGGNG